MAYVYTHRRNDNGEIFYVGIGHKINRAYSKCGRNPYWRNITAKTDFEVRLVHRNVGWNEAKELEKYLIALYGRKDKGEGSLVNLTDGGDGVLGFPAPNKGKKASPELRALLSEMKKGEKNGFYGKSHFDEAREKIRKSKLGTKMSETSRAKMSEYRKGRPLGGKLVLNLETGIYYESAKDAAQAHRITYSYLSGKLNGRWDNNTSLRYV